MHLGTEREFKLTLVALIAVSITMLIVPYAKTTPVRLDGSLAIVVPFDDGAVVAADSRTVVSDKLACDETYKIRLAPGNRPLVATLTGHYRVGLMQGVSDLQGLGACDILRNSHRPFDVQKWQ